MLTVLSFQSLFVLLAVFVIIGVAVILVVAGSAVTSGADGSVSVLAWWVWFRFDCS